MRPIFKLLNVSITFDLITLHVDRKSFWQHRFPTWCGTLLLLVFVNEDSAVVYFISVWHWFRYICCCCCHNVLSICICIYLFGKAHFRNFVSRYISAKIHYIWFMIPTPTIYSQMRFRITNHFYIHVWDSRISNYWYSYPDLVFLILSMYSMWKLT